MEDVRQVRGEEDEQNRQTQDKTEVIPLKQLLSSNPDSRVHPSAGSEYEREINARK